MKLENLKKDYSIMARSSSGDYERLQPNVHFQFSSQRWGAHLETGNRNTLLPRDEEETGNWIINHVIWISLVITVQTVSTSDLVTLNLLLQLSPDSVLELYFSELTDQCNSKWYCCCLLLLSVAALSSTHQQQQQFKDTMSNFQSTTFY